MLKCEGRLKNAQVAYVTFKDTQGADTVILLTGAKIVDLSVNITPVEDYELPAEALLSNSEKNLVVTGSSVKKAEDMVSTMLAKGCVLGKDAIAKAKAFDEQHQLTLNASAAMREMDERYQVSEKTKFAFSVAEQKASIAGTAIMSNNYVSTGASWLSNAFNAVAKAAEDVGVLTKEKVEKAEEEKTDSVDKERARIINDFAQLHLDESSIVEPVDSTTDKKA
ncbi:Detected protein of confused Function [Hibiscus syriacus]|uniref:Detected protein of confused Function n=1 Tax=Hibiscus syriacus TaxID=106335 RepID=A0A6A2ZKW3_HIBSY|nr:Detected protein of confused Function [Hibiscus syriacus]